MKVVMDINQLSKLPILMRLPEDILAHVSERGSMEKLQSGQDVCRENTPAEAVIWLMSGRLKTSVETGEKEETVIDILSKKAKLGLAEVCEGGNYSVSAQAIEEAVVFRLNKADFEDLLASHFEFQMAVFAHISVEMRGAVKEINDLKLKNTSRRLGAYLLAMTPKEDGEAEIDLAFGKRLLAARLAMKPESLSRALAKLKSAGVVSERNRIHIADISTLKEYCGEEDDILEGALS